MQIRDSNRPAVVGECPEYLDYLSRRSAFRVVHNAGIARGKSFSSIAKDLISSTTGIIREKALLHFIGVDHRYKFSDDPEWVYSKALELMSSKRRKSVLKSLIDSRRTGAKAFDFSMTDTSGRTVRLHDFKGKVVMIEVWYTGCGGCAGLAEVIKSSVLPHFIHNQEVVFVTVNVSNTKQRWKEGIASGLYTNEKSINLYTNGETINHPFVRYYQFQGFPQLLLIGKDGNLITSGLSRQAEVIKEKIKLALSKS
jgi:hypothetical protein